MGSKFLRNYKIKVGASHVMSSSALSICFLLGFKLCQKAPLNAVGGDGCFFLFFSEMHVVWIYVGKPLWLCGLSHPSTGLFPRWGGMHRMSQARQQSILLLAPRQKHLQQDVMLRGSGLYGHVKNKINTRRARTKRFAIISSWEVQNCTRFQILFIPDWNGATCTINHWRSLPIPFFLPDFQCFSYK